MDGRLSGVLGCLTVIKGLFRRRLSRGSSGDVAMKFISNFASWCTLAVLVRLATVILGFLGSFPVIFISRLRRYVPRAEATWVRMEYSETIAGLGRLQLCCNDELKGSLTEEYEVI